MISRPWRSLRSEEHTSELQSHDNLVCRLLLGKTSSPAGTFPPLPPTPTRPLAHTTAQPAPPYPRPRRAAPARPGDAVHAVFFLMIRRPPGPALFPSPGPSH